MYNCTLAPYTRKPKYRSYRAPFKYSLAFKMANKAKSNAHVTSANPLY